MKRTIAALVVCLAAVFCLASPSLAAQDESHTSTATSGGYISIKTATSHIRKLSQKLATKQGAESFRIFTPCHHAVVNGVKQAGLVTCKVRFRFVDTDGAVGFTRFKATATPRLTTLTPYK